MDVLTITKAADFLNVSTSTLRNWDRSGKLVASRDQESGRLFYSQSQLERVQNDRSIGKRPNRLQPNKEPNDTVSVFPGSPKRPAINPEDLGQHMTPLDIGRQMACFVQRPIDQWMVLDPACGDGNLLAAAAEQMQQAGLRDIDRRIVGVEIDASMADMARANLSAILDVPPAKIQIITADFLDICQRPLLSETAFSLRDFNVVLSNPPYGRSREFRFFESCARGLSRGSELVFLMPLSFIDRVVDVFSVPLRGRPLGVTTGHAIIRHVSGDRYKIRSVKDHQVNSSLFSVLTGAKLYEVGAGNPRQTRATLDSKPYSSEEALPGWLPCLRTGDIHPYCYDIGRLYIDYGENLAHPKEIERFSGPRLFVRRVPIWANRQLGAAFINETAVCAGDILVIKHQDDDVTQLKGLCVFLNSKEAAEWVLKRRPSVRYRDSFPKLSAKDINALLDSGVAKLEDIASLAARYIDKPNQVEREQRKTTGRPRAFVEQDFPVSVVSSESSREKSIRQGHISTLQMWWARRPLSTCRTALFSALVPDPDDPNTSEEWKKKAGAILPGIGSLRERLFDFVARLSTWEAGTNEALLDIARQLIKTHHSKPPVVLDSFAGGGSFPIEALRLGLNAKAGELNPVAVLTLKASVEWLPNCRPRLLDAYQSTCNTLVESLSDVARRLYGNSDTEEVLAFLWCRTYQCPECKAQSPLYRDRILASGKRCSIVEFDFSSSNDPFGSRVVISPGSKELEAAKTGSVSARGAVCARCNSPTPLSLLRELGRRDAIGEHIYAIRIRTKDGISYRSPTSSDHRNFEDSRLRRVRERRVKHVPNEKMDVNGIRHTWAMQYGVTTTRKLFNKRQGHALLELAHEMRIEAIASKEKHSLSKNEYDALIALLSFTMNRLVMYSSRHSWWQSNGEFPASMFGRQAIPFVWNYSEIPFSSSAAGGLASASQWVLGAAQHCSKLPEKGKAFCSDAGSTRLKENSVDVVAIDPPYYDSIAYGYLSDVFYVWMKACMSDMFPTLFSEQLSPKTDEAIVDRPHKLAPMPKGDLHYRRKMNEAFCELRRVMKSDGIMLVMFGHKKTAAWEAFLTPLIEAGFTPTASWPIHTERKSKFRHGRIAALSSSCLIACRITGKQRQESIDWDSLIDHHRESLIEDVRQYRRCHFWGSDLLTAMIGPVVAAYQQYSDVTTTEGDRMSISGVLEQLPQLVFELQLNYVLNEPELERHTGERKWLCSLKNDGATNVRIPRGGVLGRFVSDFSDTLIAGDTREADAIWHEADFKLHGPAQTFLEGVSVLAPDGSPLRQLAESSLGRISMLLRRNGHAK